MNDVNLATTQSNSRRHYHMNFLQCLCGRKRFNAQQNQSRFCPLSQSCTTANTCFPLNSSCLTQTDHSKDPAPTTELFSASSQTHVDISCLQLGESTLLCRSIDDTSNGTRTQKWLHQTLLVESSPFEQPEEVIRST